MSYFDLPPSFKFKQFKHLACYSNCGDSFWISSCVVETPETGYHVTLFDKISDVRYGLI